MHNDKELVQKYMKPLLVGKLEEEDIKQSDKQVSSHLIYIFILNIDGI